MKKRFISLLLTLAMVLALVPSIGVPVLADTVASGTCGENLTWILDDGGTLTISGTGDMTEATWDDYESQIKAVVVESGVTSIVNSAFSWYAGLTSVTLPDSVTQIGRFAFAGCDSLVHVTLGSGLISIGEFAFNSCALLQNIDLPEGLTELGEGAFAYCKSLESIDIPEGITTISLRAFEGCASFTTITIPGNVSTIIQDAFRGCSSMVSYDVSSENEYFYSDDGVLIGREYAEVVAYPQARAASTYNIPADVKQIANHAFEGCKDLKSVTIPDGLEYIGEEAFKDCTGLKNIILSGGEYVNIQGFAFDDCTSLEYVVIPGAAKLSIMRPTFEGCSNLKTVRFMGDANDRYASILEDCTDGLQIYYDEGTQGWTSPEWNGYACSVWPSSDFADICLNVYYEDAVAWAVVEGVTSGVSIRRFNPNDPCTRGQVVSFLWRVYGEQEPTITENPFPDVPDNKYYTKAVLWAVEKGIAAGKEGDIFDPYGTVSRADFVTFLWRAFGSPEPESDVNPFPDVPNNKYYTKAVIWAAENGIAAGNKDGTFAPKSACTRAQVVSFLYRAYGQK